MSVLITLWLIRGIKIGILVTCDLSMSKSKLQYCSSFHIERPIPDLVNHNQAPPPRALTQNHFLNFKVAKVVVLVVQFS